jgi:hypothetical protein
MLEVLRGCRDHQDSSGKTLPLIVDGKPASRTEDAGVETLWRGATRNPGGRFGPEKRGQKGVVPGHGVDFPASELFVVSAWEFWRCNSLQRCRPRP